LQENIESDVEELQEEEDHNSVSLVVAEDEHPGEELLQKDEEGNPMLFKVVSTTEQETGKQSEEHQIDENFFRMKKEKQIGLLFNQLKRERVRVEEQTIKMGVLKDQYAQKCEKINELSSDNEELLEQLAQMQVQIDR